jgi:hypothetical protein
LARTPAEMILQEFLGLSDEEIADLHQVGIV